MAGSVLLHHSVPSAGAASLFSGAGRKEGGGTPGGTAEEDNELDDLCREDEMVRRSRVVKLAVWKMD